MWKILVTVCLALLAAPLAAKTESVTPASQLPRELEGIGFDQNLNAQVDLDLEFTDSTGKAVRLGDYFGDKPVILALVYYECPMLCNLELNGLVKALRALSMSPAQDFQVVTVSFNPNDTPAMAAKKKQQYLESYRRDGAGGGWHFLVGGGEAIDSLTSSVGFRYRFDDEAGLYRHASGIVTLTPAGRVSRYQFGVEYSARDLRFGLIEASDFKIGSPVDSVMLFCFHYDPITGKYGFVVMNALRLAGLLTVGLLGGFVLLSLWRDRARKREDLAHHGGAAG